MGLVGGQIAELVVFIFCVSLFILYHVWYFLLPELQLFPSKVEHINLWITSVKTRSLWCELMMRDKGEALTAVQTTRNLIISVSLLATAEAAIISTLLNLITDPARLQQINIFSEEDPISGGVPLMSPALKIGLAMGALFLSFLTFAQCVRISVHLGFLIRVVPSHPHIQLPLRDETIILMQRASLYFTVGLRLLYAFVPLALYMVLGTLAFLIATVIMLVFLFMLDTVPATAVAQLMRVSTMASAEAAIRAQDSFLESGTLTQGAESIQGDLRRRSAEPSTPVARWHMNM